MTDATLSENNVDDLGRILMALIQEVWIMRDRMAIIEALLEERAGIGKADIEDYVGDATFSKGLLALRDRFAAHVLGAPVAGRERSVDQILARAGYDRAAVKTG